MTDLRADFMPLLQLLEQEDQVLQPLSEQSTGQARTLQELVDVSAPQAPPPYAAAMLTERRRVLEPLPQDLVQLSQLPQEESTQSIGQVSVLQLRCFFKVGQITPPDFADRMMERERDWYPVPQLWLHFVHSSNTVTMQSIGHESVLQVWTWGWSPGQAIPPYRAAVTILLSRVWIPEPHVLVQVDQFSKLDMTQFTGQDSVLHTRC